MHASPVESSANGLLRSEEQVLRHSHLRHQGELLEHRTDAEAAGVLHRLQDYFLAVQHQTPLAPLGAGDD
ncbi:hypothetical protein D3C85_1587910 [compost metagenome]